MNEYSQPAPSPFAQPAPYSDDDTYIPQQATAPASYDLTMSYLASYALTLTDEGRANVRASIPADKVAQYDQCFAIQDMKGEAESSDRRRRMLEGELESLAVRDEAKTLYAKRKIEALADAGADAAAVFATKVLDTDSLANIVVPDPLIADYLDLNCTARLYGPSGSKKSFVMLDMAACVAQGIDWHGKATTQRDVLYVVSEGSTGIMRRVRAWEREYGRKMTGVHFYTEAVQIADPEQMRNLIAYAKQISAGMVIFDTQARSTVGIDENSNTDMGRVVAALDKLRQETEACVMLVHHSGNEGGRARGATAVLGAMDAEFEVSCPDRGMKVTLKTTKRKDGEEQPKVTFRLVEHDVETTRGTETSLSVGQYATVGDFTEGGIDDVVTERNLTAKQQDVLVAVARLGTASGQDVVRDCGITRQRAKERLDSLAKLGCVKQVGAADSPKYVIEEIGWTTLTRYSLTNGYHSVPAFEDEGEADAAA